jgi:hypothetical protein
MILLRKSARTLHGRLNFRGLEISVENRTGSIRQWKNSDDGTEGMTRMRHAYGYFKGTMGCDQDAVDVFVGPHREAPNVYIIDQMKAPDFIEFDEQKILVGFLTQEDAKKFYLAHYDDPRFFGRIAEMDFEEFREKVMKTRDNGGKPIVKAIDRLAERVRAALRKSREVEGSGRYFSTDELRAAAQRAPGMNEIMVDMSDPIGRLITEAQCRERARRSIHPQVSELLLGKTRAMTQMIEQHGRILIAVAGGDPQGIDFVEFRRGYKVEMEHKDVTGGDPVKTAKIVLAHLKENDRYYSLLEKYVEKAFPGVHLLRRRA